MRDVLQSTARKFKIYMADSSAPTSGKTGLSSFTVYLAKDGLSESTVAPSITERGHGWYEVTPLAAHRDTLGENCWTFVASGAVDYVMKETVIAIDQQVATQPVNVTQFGGTNGTFNSGKPDVGAATSVSGAVGSVTGAVGSVTGNVGGNVNGNVVGSVASVTGNVGGNVSGNVSGSVGSVTGAVGSVTGSVGSVVGSVGGSVASVAGAVGSVTGNVGGDVSGKVLGGGSGTISGDGVRAASVTGAVGSVTGSVGSVVGAVVLDSASRVKLDATQPDYAPLKAGDYTAPSNSDIAAIKAKTDNLPSDPADQSLVEAAISSATSGLGTPSQIADAVWDEAMSGHTTNGTYGGRIVRASNSNVEIQITGSQHVAADVHEFQAGVITAGDFANNSITAAALAADAVAEIQNGLSTLTAPQVNAEVVDALSVDTYAELTAPPAATSSLKDKITWLFMYARNKVTQTAAQRKLYRDDGTTVAGTSGTTDDGTTFTKGEDA